MSFVRLIYQQPVTDQLSLLWLSVIPWWKSNKKSWLVSQTMVKFLNILDYSWIFLIILGQSYHGEIQIKYSDWSVTPWWNSWIFLVSHTMVKFKLNILIGQSYHGEIPEYSWLFLVSHTMVKFKLNILIGQSYHGEIQIKNSDWSVMPWWNSNKKSSLVSHTMVKFK